MNPSRPGSSHIHQTANFCDPDEDIIFRIKSLMGPGHYIMLPFVRTLILYALCVLSRGKCPWHIRAAFHARYQVRSLSLFSVER